MSIRTLLRILLCHIPTGVIVAAMVVVVAAQVIRDRNFVLAMLFYVPVWPVAAVAVLWDLLRLGRALPLRWLLLCLGIGLGIISVGMLWSPARVPSAGESRPAITVLQWNVQWGGRYMQRSLDAIVGEIQRHDPQIILLSEAPPQQWLMYTWNLNQPGWRYAVHEFKPGGEYWFRMTVLSRWPVRQTDYWRLPTGRAALFEVATPYKPIVVLMVDLESAPWLRREPSLLAIAQIVDQLIADGIRVDLIAGDFNAPARSLGFDAILRSGIGFDRAAMWSGQWRATWPSQFPMWDIDHVLIRRGIGVNSAGFFANPATDHRGQVVKILP